MPQVLENLWRFKTTIEEAKVNALSKELNIHPVLAGLLFQRDVKTFEEAKVFFRSSLELLHDPWLMKDMDKAVQRIEEAISRDERIMVLGDYDVDGTTATALMYQFLSELTENLEYYIPDRYNEGYGISIQSIDYAAQEKVGLIISLDCGIKANDKVDYALSKNIDFIICDHHTPSDQLPKAIAVLDPKRKDCNYPYKELSGCGVGFKLIQALAQKLTIPEKVTLEGIDLLATSIAADIVPVTGENRLLAKYGLQKINRNPSPGIAAMKEIAGNKREYSISDVVFKIAPRINSAGRMSSGKEAVEILISDNKETATEKVANVNKHNEDRRATDKDITIQAFEQIELDGDFSSRKTTVLFDPSWHKGVIGIVASRMIEKFYRPTIIFTSKDGVLSGSARSVNNFNIYNALTECSDLLLQYGGHMYAAGMTLLEENYEAFKEKFDRVVSEMIREEHLKPVIEIDADLNLSDINQSFYKILKQFAPFGPGNMDPVFRSQNLVIENYRLLTDKYDNGHLKFSVFDPSNEYQTFDVIGFGMGNRIDELDSGVMIDLLYTIDENTWNGRTTLQLVAKDLKLV